MKRTAIIAALMAACMARATDVQIGGGRSLGMGGVGIALPYNGQYEGRVNPAHFAYTRRALSFKWPSFGYTLRGIGYSDLRDRLKGIDSGGLDIDTLGDYARTFSDSVKTFSANGEVGLGGSGVDVSVEGQAFVRTLPNAPLKAWNAQTGGNLQQLATNPAYSDSRLDGFGYGYYSILLGYGTVLKNPEANKLPGEFAVGGRLKLVRGFYTHSFVDKNAIVDNSGGIRAPEMGGDDVLEKSGVGLDIGALFSTGPGKKLRAGLMLENAIRPNATFHGTDPTGALRDYNPFKQMVHSGFGAELGDRALVGLDFYDMGNRAGLQETRLGAELRVTRGFSLRAGGGTRNGLSAGIDLGGFNIAFAGRLPVRIESAFRF